MPVSLPLRTARLDLRAFTAADGPVIAPVFGDPEVMRHVGGGRAADATAIAEMLRAYVDHQAAHGFSFWAVLERRTGALIGDAGLYHQGTEVQLGYTLGRAWWGRGLATEAGHACLDAAFGELGLQEVVAIVDPANAASQGVVAKLGMTSSGTRRAYGREHLVFRARG